MSYRIEEIEGIGPAYGARLAAAGIATTADLLKMCCDAKGRKPVAKDTGLSETLVLKWVNLADLMRVSGIGSAFSELLEAAGVDTVKELRNRNAANLAARMAEVNAVKKLTHAVPSETGVTGWVEQAKSLPPVVTH